MSGVSDCAADGVTEDVAVDDVVDGVADVVANGVANRVADGVANELPITGVEADTLAARVLGAAGDSDCADEVTGS